MTECLETKKSNCKNCYKCIRHCPVKSLKFTAGQAHIIREECVLCGECYVVCPQNAKQIRNDVDKVKAFIASGEDVYVSLAPSFAAWFRSCTAKDVESALKKLGICGAAETAIGAQLVSKQYEDIISKGDRRIIISSCCHTVNTLIERHFEKALPYLANVATPMHVHGKILKKEHPGCKVVFVGPCISKKAEAEKYPGVVDAVLTFDELDSWLETENIAVVSCHTEQPKKRTNAYPTSGGILRSMNCDNNFDYVVVDGMEACINTLRDIDNDKLANCFIEMSACSGSCVGGPIMKKKKRNPIMDLLSVNKGYGNELYNTPAVSSSEAARSFSFEGAQKPMPGSTAIDEILRKMGKTSVDKELNCGSCGYDTCRDKAVAVFMGKADLSMCLPFLKEKAESFSDTIIHNTPNGVMVLDCDLNVQQINAAARKILNLSGAADILGGPVVRILDPTDYVLALSSEKNVYDKRKFLAEYQKYVEETIVYDKEYRIIMVLMKDISAEEQMKLSKENQCKAAVEITDKVVEKQMRVVQEIASLLGETTAETKIALTKLKETLTNDE